jgi:hypothetical protein
VANGEVSEAENTVDDADDHKTAGELEEIVKEVGDDVVQGKAETTADHVPSVMPQNSVASGCTKSSTSETVFNVEPPEFPAKLDPSTPFFKIKELADVFFNHRLPRREKFAQKPPSDRKVRVKKGKTLNEGVAKVILKDG